MNVGFFQEYAPVYLEAGLLTLRIGVIGIIGAILFGLICSLIQYYKVPILRRIVGGYIEISRNTPLLIQLFFLYFGLPKLGILLSSEMCGIVGLIFLGGSYMSESFRSGLESLSKTQIEAGKSIGLTEGQILRHIILPQAMAVAFPSFSANVIFLLKETSVFSAVALADLMYVTKELIGLYYETDEALTMLVLSYLIILLPISLFFAYLERRMRHGGFGTTSAVSGK
ncbi:amino acid ABC transporter permease [Peptoniphilus sp. KCTC 25270]|uniref:amino acid ABC transporter permease n=1 Tax=Peptoniphilus sp. KCTC 25270 TaxID=2897414 RepID=UPI001E2E8206|nr:amino acid ABC transporter permease [Peptoniphilus sp. KCTC 25270]MCD1147598.1 amino acid ABC transporter permease [Peptoniphilus sp. KCTC 25270]